MNFEVSVLFEGSDYVVVNKPAGLVVHADGRTDEYTLCDWILEHYPEIRGVGESMIVGRGDAEVIIERPGIVHRLDRDTSGVMVIARNQQAFLELKQLFHDRKVSKEYRGFVYGHVSHDSGTVSAGIGKSTRDFRRWSSGRGARGVLRHAETEYNVFERFEYGGELYTYCAFYPKTGRTHQIRVHAKHVNHPLAGDVLYAGKNIEKGASEGHYALGFDRQALHAYRLSFHWRGEDVSYEAPFPVDFEAALRLF